MANKKQRINADTSDSTPILIESQPSNFWAKEVLHLSAQNWLKLKYWTYQEALYLLHGLDPDAANNARENGSPQIELTLVMSGMERSFLGAIDENKIPSKIVERPSGRTFLVQSMRARNWWKLNCTFGLPPALTEQSSAKTPSISKIQSMVDRLVEHGIISNTKIFDEIVDVYRRNTLALPCSENTLKKWISSSLGAKKRGRPRKNTDTQSSR